MQQHFFISKLAKFDYGHLSQLTKRCCVDSIGNIHSFSFEQRKKIARLGYRHYLFRYRQDKNTHEMKDTGWVHCLPMIKQSYSGWKFHISIHHDDMERAIPALMQILLFCTFSIHIKFRPHDKLQDSLAAKDNSVGKEFVIYCHNGVNIEEWKRLFIAIENCLLELKIRRGQQLSKGDRFVPGSCYLGYRCDTNLQGQYIPADPHFFGAYNPEERIDPFFDFIIESDPSEMDLRRTVSAAVDPDATLPLDEDEDKPSPLQRGISR